MQKICKECGEVFEATSAKQQYCSKLHFRPCPVCGKLVPAKYLSDPARCCSRECSSKRSSDKQLILPKSVATVQERKEEFITPDEAFIVLVDAGSVSFRGTYTGPSTCGFIKDHTYDVSVTRNAPYYEVTANKDVTTDASVEHTIYLSSLISVKHYFEK